MSNTNDGGYAFPRPLPDIKVSPDEALDLIRRYSGMTLRDHFAAQALTGLLARKSIRDMSNHWFANSAYQMADAMIAARGTGRSE